MDLQDAVRLIQNKSGTDYDTVLANIEEKYKELAGLVTKEGAAYLVARQLGIEISNNKDAVSAAPNAVKTRRYQIFGFVSS